MAECRPTISRKSKIDRNNFGKRFPSSDACRVFKGNLPFTSGDPLEYLGTFSGWFLFINRVSIKEHNLKQNNLKQNMPSGLIQKKPVRFRADNCAEDWWSRCERNGGTSSMMEVSSWSSTSKAFAIKKSSKPLGKLITLSNKPDLYRKLPLAMDFLKNYNIRNFKRETTLNCLIYQSADWSWSVNLCKFRAFSKALN